MKQPFTLLLLLFFNLSFAQCEERTYAGSVSLHLSTGARNGFGGELGSQGMIGNFSGFLGINISHTKGYKEKDNSISVVYVKAVYRFYQNSGENLYFAGVIAPALVNTDFELLSGARLLYVTGRNTAVSLEPLWYLKEKRLFVNLNIHFLL